MERLGNSLSKTGVESQRYGVFVWNPGLSVPFFLFGFQAGPYLIGDVMAWERGRPAAKVGLRTAARLITTPPASPTPPPPPLGMQACVSLVNMVLGVDPQRAHAMRDLRPQ